MSAEAERRARAFRAHELDTSGRDRGYLVHRQHAFSRLSPDGCHCVGFCGLEALEPDQGLALIAHKPIVVLLHHLQGLPAASYELCYEGSRLERNLDHVRMRPGTSSYRYMYERQKQSDELVTCTELGISRFFTTHFTGNEPSAGHDLK